MINSHKSLQRSRFVNKSASHGGMHSVCFSAVYNPVAVLLSTFHTISYNGRYSDTSRFPDVVFEALI